MAALTVVQGTGGTTSTGNPSLAFGSNTTGGSFLLAWVGAPNAVTIGTPTDTLLNTWVKIGSTITYSASGSAAFFYVASNKVGGGANTVQFATTAAGSSSYGIMEFTGQAVSNPLDQTSAIASFTSTTSLATFTTIATSAANEEVIVMFLASNVQVLTAGAGFAVTALTGTMAIDEYGVFAVAGTQTVTGTMTAARTMVGLAISVKSTSTPVTGGGGNSSWLTINLNNSLRGLKH